MQVLTGSTRGCSDVSVLECDEAVSVAYGIHRRQYGSDAPPQEIGVTYGSMLPPVTHPGQPEAYREALVAIYLRDCRQAVE